MERQKSRTIQLLSLRWDAPLGNIMWPWLFSNSEEDQRHLKHYLLETPFPLKVMRHNFQFPSYLICTFLYFSFFFFSSHLPLLNNTSRPNLGSVLQLTQTLSACPPYSVSYPMIMWTMSTIPAILELEGSVGNRDSKEGGERGQCECSLRSFAKWLPLAAYFPENQFWRRGVSYSSGLLGLINCFFLSLRQVNQTYKPAINTLSFVKFPL